MDAGWKSQTGGSKAECQTGSMHHSLACLRESLSPRGWQLWQAARNTRRSASARAEERKSKAQKDERMVPCFLVMDLLYIYLMPSRHEKAESL
jgi:hypothetical protein